MIKRLLLLFILCMLFLSAVMEREVKAQVPGTNCLAFYPIIYFDESLVTVYEDGELVGGYIFYQNPGFVTFAVAPEEGNALGFKIDEPF